jgi:hypothetical protein
MTNILPLRSGTIDPIFVDLFRAVDTVARTTGHDFLVFGATARDLVLEGVYGIKATRKTRDVDLAFALRSWDEYDTLRQLLVATGRFTQAPRIRHRLYFCSTIEVDIVPFGALESPPGEIAWPPDGAMRMKTFGLDRARSDALIVGLADGLRIHVASIRTQALLVRLRRASVHDVAWVIESLRCGASCIPFGGQGLLGRPGGWQRASRFQLRGRSRLLRAGRMAGGGASIPGLRSSQVSPHLVRALRAERNWTAIPSLGAGAACRISTPSPAFPGTG